MNSSTPKRVVAEPHRIAFQYGNIQKPSDAPLVVAVIRLADRYYSGLEQICRRHIVREAAVGIENGAAALRQKKRRASYRSLRNGRESVTTIISSCSSAIYVVELVYG